MYNFENICRTCSSDGELQSIFDNYPFNINEILTEIVNITIMENDNYPQKICTNCLDKLCSAYNFKLQCQEIQKKYEKYLNNLDLKNEFLIDGIDIKEENYFEETEDIDLSNNYDEEEDEKVKMKKKIVRKKQMCKVCNQSVTKLYEHMRSHTNEKPYKCETCHKQFSLSSNYKRHLRSHSGEKFSCNLCERSFTRKYALREHERAHELYPNENLKLSNRERPFLCSICGKGFAQRSALDSHTNVHTGARPYKCKLCEKTFSQNAALSTHQLTHTGEKRFKCTYCEKQFSHRNTMIHHELIHTGGKPYKCDLCDQSFRQHQHLKVHKRIHSGDKPHKCEICEKQFSLKSNLTVHVRTHTGETPYICEVCSKGFYDSSSLKKHKKKHNLFSVENEQQIIERESIDLSLVKLNKNGEFVKIDEIVVNE